MYRNAVAVIISSLSLIVPSYYTVDVGSSSNGQKPLEIIMHVIENGLKCENCASVFTHTDEIIDHIKNNHAEYLQKTEKTCPACLKQYTKMSSLKDHMMKYALLRKYKCPVCFVPMKRKSVVKHKIAHELKEAVGDALTFNICLNMTIQRSKNILNAIKNQEAQQTRVPDERATARADEMIITRVTHVVEAGVTSTHTAEAERPKAATRRTGDMYSCETDNLIATTGKMILAAESEKEDAQAQLKADWEMARWLDNQMQLCNNEDGDGS